ncbi:MAG: CotH kinase family protein [Flavobacteriales bacterium]
MRETLAAVHALSRLALGALAAAVLAAAVGRPEPAPKPQAHGPVPSIEPVNALAVPGQAIAVKATMADRLWLSLDGELGRARPHGSTVQLRAEPPARQAERALATATAIQWRRPVPGLPAAMVVRAAEAEAGRAGGPCAMRTNHFARPGLAGSASPTSPEGLLGPECGMAVPGHAILRASAQAQRAFAKDRRWWKYPGNYHERGKAWQREARIQLIAPDGEEVLQADAGLRINGQMTRGFPQHALRLIFREPIAVPVFADGDGNGARALVMRAAGNDQVKAMLRDAFQHRLCEGLPFGTRKALTCVAYINGAYQGVHHLRPRIDQHELARLHGLPAKRIAILEDHNRPYRGDSAEARAFAQLVRRTERWDGASEDWVDSLEARIDVDGFLAYMASQTILGNMDWPKQNVMYWRWTGRRGPGVRDGRWRFIMGDSDLGFGAVAPPEADLFAAVKNSDAPVARLLRAMLRNPALKERFIEQGLAQLDGPLAATRCVAVLDSMAAAMEPEMERHCMRWRKPASVRSWRREVEALRSYALARMPAARAQLTAMRTR